MRGRRGEEGGSVSRLRTESVISSKGNNVKRCGLQCGPALVHPLVLSPNWWTWIPRSADGSLPWISHEIVVSEDSEPCSNVTVPVTFESPLRTATVPQRDQSQHTVLKGRAS